MNSFNLLTEKQKLYMEQDAYAEERKRVHESWFNETTTDFWRHKRMYETIRPFADSFRDASWLTVGDGRFGLDAIRLKKLFDLKSIFPTDISENMLRISREKGLIQEYGVENAERLSFQDNSFDVVFCKEAFHHFPRPYLAMYEMLRVSRQAVILIEPAENIESNGPKTKQYLLSAAKLFLTKLLGLSYRPYLPTFLNVNHAFEEAGNYVYGVSVREMEKLVHGMDLGGIAWKGFNDVYAKGGEFEEAKEGKPIFDSLIDALAQLDQLCERYPAYHHPNMVTVILFKQDPKPEIKIELEKVRFSLPVIYKNSNLPIQNQSYSSI